LHPRQDAERNGWPAHPAREGGRLHANAGEAAFGRRVIGGARLDPPLEKSILLAAGPEPKRPAAPELARRLEQHAAVVGRQPGERATSREAEAGSDGNSERRKPPLPEKEPWHEPALQPSL